MSAADPRPRPVGTHACERLAKGLRAQGVGYVYWKPRSGLAAALEGGRKDLDIFTLPQDLERARDVLTSLQHKRFVLPPGSLPGSEAWVSWDPWHDRFHLVHLHWELVTGLPGVHEQRLPFGPLAVRRAVPGLMGLSVLRPEDDLVLLLVRAFFEPKLMSSQGGLSDLVVREVREALGVLEPARVVEAAQTYLGASGAELGLLLTSPDFLDSPGKLRRCAALVRSALAPMRASAAEVHARRWVKSVRAFAGSRLPRRRTRRRLGREGGLVVALIGPDGAGKSTLASELERWLEPLFEVRRLYFGRGDWVSATRQHAADLKWAVLERVRSRPRPAPAGAADDDGKHQSGVSSKASLLRWVRDVALLAAAGRKLAEARTAERWRKLGAVLITDRFPHPQERLCDGPGIVISSADPAVRRWLARLEQGRYRKVGRLRPNLLVRLVLPPEVSIRRKPDHRIQDVRAKLEAVRRVRFDAGTTVEISADAPLESVLAELKARVWSAL